MEIGRARLERSPPHCVSQFEVCDQVGGQEFGRFVRRVSRGRVSERGRGKCVGFGALLCTTDQGRIGPKRFHRHGFHRPFRLV